MNNIRSCLVKIGDFVRHGNIYAHISRIEPPYLNRYYVELDRGYGLEPLYIYDDLVEVVSFVNKEKEE